MIDIAVLCNILTEKSVTYWQKNLLYPSKFSSFGDAMQEAEIR